MNRQQLYRAAFDTIASRRQRAVTLAKQQETAFCQRVPQWTALQQEKIQAGVRTAMLGAGGAAPAAIEQAAAEVQRLEQACSELLAANGLSGSGFAPAYTCPLCKDTGYIGTEVCECVHTLVRQLRQKEVNETSPLCLCSFDTFHLDKYPARHVPELGVTAQQHMAQILAYCRAYAQHFNPHSTSLYLCGYAGLGKTHLALSIARAVLERGYDVMYVSAQDAFDRVEKERFGEDGGTMQNLLDAELLILDDLGTEYISPYVSACLYSLINGRSNRRMPTIYTSNIVSDSDLRRRYTEKISSRLLGSCEVLSFCGEDIRLLGK